MNQAANIDSSLTRLLIGGARPASASGETIAIEDPATEQQIASVPRGGAVEIDRAVAAARATFESRAWSHMRAADRGRLLESIARMIELHAEELALLESYDTGKPVSMARMIDLPATIDVFRYMGGWCTKMHGSTLPVSFDGKEYHAYTRREPLGVIGAITPWNYPLALGAWKIASALAAGCTVVVKPSELTPLSTLRLAELCLEAGLPEGALNVVTGVGHEAGRALAEHPGVNKISFTGSTATGKQIAVAALGNMKRVTLELGGKSPSIVFADADLDQVGAGAALAAFFNSGQVCFAATRLFVEHSVYDKVVEAVAAAARSFPVGNGRQAQSMLGPVVSRNQMERVLGYCEKGRTEGATLVTGGKRIGDTGYFIEPTVFADTNPSMSIMREEIFGPVLSIMPFTDIEEVTALANNSNYGLAANIWTRDLKRAHKLAHRLEAGSVWINCHGVVDAALPFGGFKQSGWGREVSEEGLLAYTETKTVCAVLD
jgi:p-cumic aldehyde dehydrogenase